MRPLRLAASRPRLMVAVAAVAVAVAMQLVGAQPAVSQAPTLTAYRAANDPGLDPNAGAWLRAPAVEVPLSAQRNAWPFGGGAVKGLEAKAVHTDDMLYIRLSWADRTQDSEALAVDEFVDGAAVEFPARAASSVPALCMGQSDNGVNIWYWQAGADDGQPGTVEELSSSGYVDRYPSTDDLYFPARAAGNPIADPATMQNLVAVGFGTLDMAREQDLGGSARWAFGRWSVVFARELTHASAEQVDLGGNVATDVAFAVWDGHEKERNGIKSVSPFVVLDLSPDEPPRAVAGPLAIMIGGAAAIVAFVAREVSIQRGRSRSIEVSG